MEEAESSATEWNSGSVLRVLLYLICVCSDFAGFILIFSVSRTLADQGYSSAYLGMIGAGLSFCSGMGAILGGYLASRFDGRIVFLAGITGMLVSAGLCARLALGTSAFLPGYWLLGLGLGFLYPPLIGWLNQDEVVQVNRAGVSRRLILFCVAWNLGMMMGQLLGGRLLEHGLNWTLGAGLIAAALNLILAVIAVQYVRPFRPVKLEGEPLSAERIELATTFKRLGWIANLGGVFGGAMVIHLLPSLMVSIGIPADQHGELLASWRGVIIASYLVMYAFSFWHFRLGISVGSQLLGAAGLMVIATAHSEILLFLGLALQGQLVGYNYYSGLFYSTAGTKQEGRALAAGIHEATLATGMAMGTIAGGSLGGWLGNRAPYWLAGGFIIMLVVIQVMSWNYWKASTQQSRSFHE